MNFYEAGRIVNTHGIKGEVKIKSESSFERFNAGSVLYIDNVLFKVKKQRKVLGMDYVVFENYEDINLILPYKGKTLMISEDQLKKLDSDEFYYHELIGLKVVNEQGKHLGIVLAVRELPQGELLEVDTGKKRPALIPFRKEFIVSVGEKIVIREIEGLI